MCSRIIFYLWSVEERIRRMRNLCSRTTDGRRFLYAKSARKFHPFSAFLVSVRHFRASLCSIFPFFVASVRIGCPSSHALFHMRRCKYSACHLVGYRRRRQARLAQGIERARRGKLRVSNNRKMNLIVKSEMRTSIFISTSTERVPNPNPFWHFS